MSSEIKLKLLSGSKVVLAECLGYESELFVPIILKNRIVLQNAVPARGCCKHEKENESKIYYPKKLSFPAKNPLANSTPKANNSENTSSDQYTCPIRKRRTGEFCESSKFSLSKELTIKPLQIGPQIKNDKIYTNLLSDHHISKVDCIEENRLPTPDIVRRAPVRTANESIPLPQYPQITTLKIVPLHRLNTINSPKNPAKIVQTKTTHLTKSINSPRILRNLSNVSSFGSPPSLQQSNKSELNSFNCGTPNQSFLARQIKTPGSTSKWRKCITPKRTYLRRSSNATSKTTSLQPLQLSRNGGLIETFRYPVSYSKNRIIIRRRKLIIDKKLKITPKKFKEQLINTEDLKRNKKVNELPKKRKQFNMSHMTAFDLLTNSGFYPRIGKKLNRVFRQGCVNKSASTILKYKQLTQDIPLIEEWN